MAFITLILGLIIGFIAGMIVAAGNWRNALNKLGLYAVNAAKPPADPSPARSATPMPMATRADDPLK